MSRVSLEECERKYNIHAERSKAENFFEKIKNKVPKIHYFLLNCTLGPTNCTVGPPNLEFRGSQAPRPPGSASATILSSVNTWLMYHVT